MARGSGETKEITLPFEAIIWLDAAKAQRQLFDPSPTVLVTYGVVIHEDRRQVILCQEHRWHEGYMGGELDFQQIPKRLILHRVAGGQITIPLERPRKHPVAAPPQTTSEPPP